MEDGSMTALIRELESGQPVSKTCHFMTERLRSMYPSLFVMRIKAKDFLALPVVDELSPSPASERWCRTMIQSRWLLRLEYRLENGNRETLTMFPIIGIMATP